MAVEIRNYQNADSTAVSGIWNSHYAMAGMPPTMSQSLWDDCVASRLFFDPKHLWIACDDGVPVGFTQLAFGCATAWQRQAHGDPILNALCIREHVNEDQIAAELIGRAIDIAGQASTGKIVAFGSPRRFAHYLVLPPLYGMMGVHATDTRAQRWLRRAGLTPARPTDCWQLPLAELKAPMDRGQMAVRRNSHIGRVINAECDSLFMANAFGHAEQTVFHLTTRSDDHVAQEIVFYCLDGAGDWADKTAMLLPPVVPADPLGVDQLTFLMVESLRQLQYERYAAVVAVTGADDLPMNNVLQRLGFRAAATGMVYERPLA